MRHRDHAAAGAAGRTAYRPGEATLIYRARSEVEAAFRGELDWLARHRGVRIVYLLGPRADPPSWLPHSPAGSRDADALRRIAPDIARSHVYICGPDAWTDAARSAARSAGVDPEHLHIERFAW